MTDNWTPSKRSKHQRRKPPPPRKDGLFTKGERPSPEMCAKIRDGVNRYYASKPLTPEQAELRQRVKDILESLHQELLAIRQIIK